MAYIAYEEAFSSVTSPHSSKSNSDNAPDPTTFAVLAAQEIERQSINTADLSAQELIDCDTRYDQVCAAAVLMFLAVVPKTWTHSICSFMQFTSKIRVVPGAIRCLRSTSFIGMGLLQQRTILTRGR